MSHENFLINPPKRIKRRVKVGGRRKPFVWPFRSKKSGRYVKSYGAMYKNPIGETLITIGANPSRRNPMAQNPWFGDSGGHRMAALMRWGKIPRGRIKRHRKRGKVVRRRAVTRSVVRRKRVKRGRWASPAVRMRKKIAQQAFWTTKYGHMLSHPQSKRVFTRKGFRTMARHKRSRKRNTWFGQPRRHRRASKKGWRRGHMLFMGTKRRRRVRHANPMATVNPRRRHHVRHRRRSYGRRRNPALGMATFGQFTSSVMNVREWGPLAVTGGLSAITGAIVPGMLGVYNPWMKLGVQTAVAIGGGLVVEKVVDKRHGQAWMIVGVAMVGYQLLKQFVIQPYFPQFAVGLGDYESYYPDQDQVSQQVGAFPGTLEAFPGVMDAYPGVGNDEVGAYPYDGAGY